MEYFLSTAAKKILIVSDVHQDVDKLEKIIKHENADINLCLGDWFDSHFYDSDAACEQTAIYLKNFVANPKNITLFGNHDLHYFFNNRYAYCSGYSNRKQDVIDQVFRKDKQEVISKFKWFTFVDEFLCTHAGLSRDFLSPIISSNESLCEYLHGQAQDCNIKLLSDLPHWFYGAGRSRGGSQNKGGLVWLDFDHEFGPIEGISQIVGHTYRKQSRVTRYRGTDNYCIDTNLHQWITISNNNFQIGKYETT